MSLAAIASSILTVIKAVPYMTQLFEEVNRQYTTMRINELNNSMDDRDRKRRALLTAIERASSDEELVQLSIILNDIGRL